MQIRVENANEAMQLGAKNAAEVMQLEVKNAVESQGEEATKRMQPNLPPKECH